MVFPQKILTDQGPGFESQLFQELMSMARIEKLRTTSYHPQTNGQCERFNSTLMNMLGTLTPDQKKDWKSHLLTMCHAYNSTQHLVTGFSPYYLMFGRHPRLPIDYQLGITRDNLAQPSKFRFVNKLNERLHEAYAKAEALTQEEANRQKKLYDKRSKDVILNPGDLVLVRIVKWTERHKIQDKWEQEEYVVVSQPDPFLPVYKVRPISGGNTRTLHRNLLLPLGLQIKSTEHQDSSDIVFDEVRQKPLAPPEVDPPKQTKNDINSNKQKPSTSEIDIDDNLSGLNEFWELVEPNVEEDEDKVSELNFSLPHIDEPRDQEIDRGLERENNEENVRIEPKAMKSGDSNQKSKSNKNSEVLKTYPKRVSRNKPCKYYDWSFYNPLNWV